MKPKIIVTDGNRDGAKIWLEHLYDNTYKLNTDKSFVLEYMRVIFDNVNDDSEIYDFNLNGKKANCNAIDPSGGPFISVGDTFDGLPFGYGMIYNVDTNKNKITAKTFGEIYGHRLVQQIEINKQVQEDEDTIIK